MPEPDVPAGQRHAPPPALLARVRRRLARMARARRARRRDRIGAGLTDVEYAARLAAGAEQAASTPETLPGDEVEIAFTTAPDVRAAIDEIFQHRFDLLGSGPTQLVARHASGERDAWRCRFEALVADLPREAVDRYEPIEWHSDFISGHRWDPSEYYLDVRVAPRAGADIKLPRELSRFQHTGMLAAAGSNDGLRERAGVEVALEMMDWIAANPIRRGVNWASAMDVAIRAVNWVWALRLFETTFARFPRVREHVVRSLYEHALHVDENLEFTQERTTNHYLADIAGLVYVGAACPQFPDSDRWLQFGVRELVSELDRQVYPDGASFEASTSYHRLAAEMFFSCAALAERLPRDRKARLFDGGVAFPESFYGKLAKMAEFTAALTKPNGLVPQFGDNDSGRFHKLSSPDRAGVARAPDAAMTFFPNAGIAVLRQGTAFLAVTCGPNGQRGFGGHGHNDKCSFELAIGEHDYVVDGGSFVYTGNPEMRNRFRSTAAHSTLWVDGREQDAIPSGLRGLFTLPERSNPRMAVEGETVVHAQHSGFGPTHSRTLTLDSRSLTIRDSLSANEPVFIGFNLDPDVRASITSTSGAQATVLLESPGRPTVSLTMSGVTNATIDAGHFSRAYGVRVPNQRIVARLTGPDATSRFEWDA